MNIKLSFTFLCLGVVLLLCGCDQNPVADLIVYDAEILTMDRQHPHAEAFAVTDGIITHVGTSTDIMKLAGETTLRLPLAGKTLLPGFNDAHMHALAIPAASRSVSDAEDVSDLIARLQTPANKTAVKQWIVAHEYDDIAIGRHLTRQDLDRVSTTAPVLAIHVSLHLYAVNSYALAAAGISATTPDPEGAKFYRDKAGNPTGLLAERAALNMLFTEAQTSPFAADFSSALSGINNIYRRLHKNGITSMTDALVPPALAAAYWFSDPEEKGMRVNLLFDSKQLSSAKTLVNVDRFLEPMGLDQFNSQWLRARGVKIFHGNSLSGRTARLLEPYYGRPDYYGEEPERSQESLTNIISEIHAAGLQAAVHANGDYEIDMVLTAIESAVKNNEVRDHRHRIEHGSVMNDDLLKRMAALAMVLAPHSYIFEKGPVLEAYGPKRWGTMFPNKTAVDLGIANAANSDFPVSALNPLLRIQSLVTRTSHSGKIYGAQQRLSVDEALYAYTMGGAFASFEENIKGSITTGKVADFTVLSQDPRRVGTMAIGQIKVDQTWVAGIRRYQR